MKSLDISQNNTSLLLYGLAIFISAFLVFSIQPLVSKMLLPFLGGSPSVWNASMLFFQFLLLGGYAYAHLLSKVKKTKIQFTIHIALLLLCVMILPIALPEGISQPDSEKVNPLFWQLGVMSAIIGAPFLILSATAPLMQHWFSKSTHPSAHDPYFLYGMSNIGSVLALILYPTLIEPLMTISGQSYTWSWGFASLGIIIFICTLLVKLNDNSILHASSEKEKRETTDVSPTFQRKLLWIFLAFCPSSLLLGTTYHITTDIAPVPLLWIAPLILYISTFIIVFSRKPIITYETALKGQIVVILLSFSMMFIKDNTFPSILNLIPTLLILFFFSLVCHYELARMRPHVKHLTIFYFMMSLGGVLGGVFNTFIALYLFNLPYEYGIILILSLLCRGASEKPIWKDKYTTDQKILFLLLSIILFALFTASYFDQVKDNVPLLIFVAAIATCILALNKKNILFFVSIYSVFVAGYYFYAAHKPINNGVAILKERNFFGPITVVKNENFTLLKHGTTLHGLQSNDPQYIKTPLFYYHPNTGIGNTFSYLDKIQNGKEQNVAVLGLGSGAMACYTAPKRHFTFYEIDPEMVQVARSSQFFSYLEKCEDNTKIIIGDGRLKIEKERDATFDSIHIDVFSSDNIPMHIITREAISIYLDKLKEDGILMFHISNNYLDLSPVLKVIGNHFGMTAIGFYNKIPPENEQDKNEPIAETSVVILTKSEKHRNALIEQGWVVIPDSKSRIWTDDYSNILSALKFF